MMPPAFTDDLMVRMVAFDMVRSFVLFSATRARRR
jgi:hypothetical protein